jgi:adenine nucleotide transporter 17
MWNCVVAQLLLANCAKTVQVWGLHGDVVHAAGNKVPGKPGAGEFFLMSALAKLGATILTYPILLVKSRLQAASKHTHADLQYSGTYDALKRIWQKEG